MSTRRKKPVLPAPVFFDEEIGLERDVALSLIESDSMANALALLLRRVCETVGWDFGQAWMPSASNRVLRVGNVWHSARKFEDHSETERFGKLHGFALQAAIRRGRGLVGRAWSSREAQWQDGCDGVSWLDSKTNSETDCDADIEYSMCSGLAVPVVFNGRVAVVLEFLSHEKRAEDRRMMNFVSALASRLTTVIEREYNDEALRRSEEWLRAAADGSVAGFSILHVVRNARENVRDLKFVFVNERAADLMALPRAQILGHNLLDLFPQAAARRFFEQCLAVIETHHSLEDEVHFRHSPHGEIWVRYQVVPVGNGVAVTAQNISARKRAEIALRESEDRFRTLIENASDIITILDEQGVILYESPSVERILGWTPEEMCGHNAFEWIHPDDADRVLDRMTQLRESGGVGEVLGFRFRCRDGNWKHLEALGNNLLDTPPVNGILINSRDISERVAQEERIGAQARELERANKRLRELATRDGLTHLKNQRAFREEIEHEWALAQRHGWPLSLAIADVDMFKRYNDTLGHQAGDRVLVRIARLMQSHSRKSDFVARYGGEEFIILMPNTSAQGATEHAERVREAIEAVRWPHLPVTASFGIATWEPGDNRDIQSGDLLFARADQALYESKHRGRNRVTHSETLPTKSVAHAPQHPEHKVVVRNTLSSLE